MSGACDARVAQLPRVCRDFLIARVCVRKWGKKGRATTFPPRSMDPTVARSPSLFMSFSWELDANETSIPPPKPSWPASTASLSKKRRQSAKAKGLGRSQDQAWLGVFLQKDLKPAKLGL